MNPPALYASLSANRPPVGVSHLSTQGAHRDEQSVATHGAGHGRCHRPRDHPGVTVPAHAAESPGEGPAFGTAPACCVLNRLLPEHAGQFPLGLLDGGRDRFRSRDPRTVPSGPAARGRHSGRCTGAGRRARRGDGAPAGAARGRPGCSAASPRRASLLELGVRGVEVAHLGGGVQRHSIGGLHMGPQYLQRRPSQRGLRLVGAAGQ